MVDYVRLTLGLVLLCSIAVVSLGQDILPRPWPPTPLGTRDRKLGENCTISQDCEAAFAVCTSSAGDAQQTCQCVAPFKPSADKQTCQPQDRHCPVGNPILANRKPIECTREYSSITNGFTSSCPDGSYCFAEFYSNAGHCCPKPKFLCPIGDPAPGRTCGAVPPPPTDGSSPTIKQCDYDTHFCFSMLSGLEPACCPLPCSQGDIFKSGKCYRPKQVGEDCQIEEQCSNSGASCINGKCVCKAGWVEQYGYCQEITCQGNPPTYARLPPQKDAAGNIISCKSDNGCADKHYCSSDFSVCCPIPTPVCYAGNNNYQEQSNPIPCANPSDCPGSDYSCNWWYSHLVQPCDGSGNPTSPSPVVGQSNFCCPPCKDCYWAVPLDKQAPAPAPAPAPASAPGRR